MEIYTLGKNSEKKAYKEAIKKFVDYAQKSDPTAPKNKWYVGISNDPERRQKEHEQKLQKDDIRCLRFMSLVRCEDRDTAHKLEIMLAEEGFAIHRKDLKPAVKTMESNIVEEIVYVYIYLTETAAERVERAIRLSKLRT